MLVPYVHPLPLLPTFCSACVRPRKRMYYVAIPPSQSPIRAPSLLSLPSPPSLPVSPAESPLRSRRAPAGRSLAPGHSACGASCGEERERQRRRATPPRSPSRSYVLYCSARALRGTVQDYYSRGERMRWYNGYGTVQYIEG